VFRAHGGTQIPDGGRRDRAGLTALAAAVVLAALTWWPSGNPAIAAAAALPRDAAGVFAAALPTVSGVLAWRLFRCPHLVAANNRMATGLIMCLHAACGAAALAAGQPSPYRVGWTRMGEAGGLAGWAVTAPAGHFSPVLAAVLLAALAAWAMRLLFGRPLG